MSDKPKIPSWQRASADQPSTSSTDPNVAIAPTPTEDDLEQPERSTSPVAVAPTPTEDDVEESDSTSLLDQARRFLDDATIRDAPRDKKIAFLEAKGVHARDIETLLGTAPGGDSHVNLEEAGERSWSTVSTSASQMVHA
tara:strand:- start:15471 stop:15890 length:420 start_codon:yes stop_codon:yes gene_type:complete